MTTLRLPLVSLPKRHHAVDLADDGVILRLAGLEELGDARQTAGDVLRLRGLARDLGDDLAGVDALAVLRDDVRADREEVARVEVAFARASSVSPVSGSLIVMRGREIGGARLDDDLAREAGDLVELLLHRDAFDEVAVLHDAADLGEDRRSRTGPTRRGSVPGFTVSPSLDLEHARRRRGGGARARGRCRRRSTSSPWRFMTTTVPSRFFGELARCSSWTMPSVRASSELCSILPRAAAPPMWNVRIVSCVPGSPIDWAAMMPTASPMLTL